MRIDPADASSPRELFGAAGRGVDAHVQGAQGGQRAHRGARVRARPDDEDPGVLPRGQVGGRQVQPDGDDRAPRSRQTGFGGDAPRGRGRALHGATQVAAEGPVLPCAVRCAAHLPRDLAFPDDHGLQARGRREQVGEGVAPPQVAQLHVLPRHRRGPGQLALDGVAERAGVGRGGCVDVDGDAVAGAQDHDAARLRARACQRGAEVGRAGEPGDVVEGGVAVVR